MLIGSHVSMSGKKMLEASAEEAHRYGASTFMIYTGAPQNTRRKAIEELNIEAVIKRWNVTIFQILSCMRLILLISRIRKSQKCLN